MRPNYLAITEDEIEDPVVRYYKKLFKERYPPNQQPLVRKMNGMGYRSWEDRLFLGPLGRVLWIEFKRPGGKPSVLQEEHHKLMRTMGHATKLVDDIDIGKQLIDALFSEVCPVCEEPRAGTWYAIELCDEHVKDFPDVLDFDLVTYE